MTVLEQDHMAMGEEAQNDVVLRSGPDLFSKHNVNVAIPSGLVVSEDHGVTSALAGVLLACDIAPVLADTFDTASREIVSGDLKLVLCQDALRDGRYSDLLSMRDALGEWSLPVIVVSATGGWPEYFHALDNGAYDFLPYPLLPGELERIIQNLSHFERQGSPGSRVGG